MPNMNIVIPIWNFGKAGGVRVLSKLANAFQEMGNRVLMISYFENNEIPYFPVDCEVRYVDKYGDFVELKKNAKSKNLFSANFENYVRYKALRNALNKLSDEYDIVIANANKTAFSVAKSKIKNKFYYIQAYEVWYKQRIGFLYNYLARKSYKLDLIKIVNADLYKNYKEIKTDYVVPPGLDLQLYHEKKESAYWDGKRPFIIGHIGRTEEWKGSNETAAAVKMLQTDGFNIKYLVAFNSPAAGSCDCELVKPDGDENLSEYYRSVDVLIAPGRIQLGAIHYPVIESMACGTPVITTGYYPATNENAYIVGVNSPVEIADAIKNIMNDYSLARKKTENAKSRIKEFAWESVSKKMLTIIEENIKN